MVSTEMIGEVLQGVHYPQDRYEVIRHATVHGATHEIIKILEKIPERQFISQDDLWDEITKVMQSNRM